MPLVPVDIAAGLVLTSDDVSQATSKLVNWQADIAGVLRMRPFLLFWNVTFPGPLDAIGFYRWKQWLVAVNSDRKIYALDEADPHTWIELSDATAATQLDGSARPVFAESPSFLYIAGGGAIQKWTGAGLTARLGGTSPNTTHIANIGQRLVAIDLTVPGRYRYSDLGEGNDSTWGALSFISAEARPDNIVALAENTAELALFGDSTLEIHGISTDPLVPFQRINTLNIGCSAPYSIVRIDSQYYWLDDRRRLISSDGRSYEVIGEAIQRDVRDLSNVTDCFGYRETTDRNDCLAWVFADAGRTWAYDLAGKKWSERMVWNGTANASMVTRAHALWPSVNVNIINVTGSSTGVNVLGHAANFFGEFKDNDFALTSAELVTGWQDFGTQNWKRSARLRVVMRRGTTALGATSSQLEIAVDDDAKGWSGFKVIDLGQPYDTLSSIDLRFGGVFRRRRYWLRYSGTDDVSIAKLADDVTDLEAAA